MPCLVPIAVRRPAAPWSADDWQRLHAQATAEVRDARSLAVAWRSLAAHARAILKAYSTSFFTVTRFLPRRKREDVEVIYAAVRYPDEVVDTFPIGAVAQLASLDCWRDHYVRGLGCENLAASVGAGVPGLLAGFADVVRRHGIPEQHYHAFLDAMRHDADPRRFETLDDLIDGYIYGSAIVVGYFLAYVYGAERPADFPRALRAARQLGIALQLTNFLRDVAEDERRGRVYLPQQMLRAEGIQQLRAADPSQHAALRRVLVRLTADADARYQSAARDLDAFAADSRTAIGACIEVYRRLNTRIAQSSRGILHRERVPFLEKYRVLPPSKVWRLPLGYLVH